eukprot:2259899-Amphidinium_carterae.2
MPWCGLSSQVESQLYVAPFFLDPLSRDLFHVEHRRHSCWPASREGSSKRLKRFSGGLSRMGDLHLLRISS